MDYDHEYYKTGTGKDDLSLPAWTVLSDLSGANQTAIQDDLEANDLTWPPHDTPAGG